MRLPCKAPARFVDHGHHALMRIDLFQAVGGYREDMSHNEDAELDLRLLKEGGRIWLEPAAAISYYPRGAPLALWRQYLGYGKGRARTLLLHARRPKLRQLLPLASLGSVLVSLLIPLHSGFLAPLVAWLTGSVLAGFAVSLQHRDRCAAASGIAAAMMHLAWSIGFASEMLNGAKGIYRREPGR